MEGTLISGYTFAPRLKLMDIKPLFLPLNTSPNLPPHSSYIEKMNINISG